MTPLLTGQNPDLAHAILYWDTGHERAVRKGNWKLRKAFQQDHAQYEMVDLELGSFLYDLDNDIGETINRYDTACQKAGELEALHRIWKQQMENNN